MTLETLLGILVVVCAVLSLVDDVRSRAWTVAALILAGAAIIALGGDVHVRD